VKPIYGLKPQSQHNRLLKSPLMRAMLVATTSVAVAEYDEASGVLELNPAAAPHTAMDQFTGYLANGWQGATRLRSRRMVPP
jgi:hypothetical protein